MQRNIFYAFLAYTLVLVTFTGIRIGVLAHPKFDSKLAHEVLASEPLIMMALIWAVLMADNCKMRALSKRLSVGVKTGRISLHVCVITYLLGCFVILYAKQCMVANHLNPPAPISYDLVDDYFRQLVALQCSYYLALTFYVALISYLLISFLKTEPCEDCKKRHSDECARCRIRRGEKQRQLSVLDPDHAKDLAE